MARPDGDLRSAVLYRAREAHGALTTLVRRCHTAQAIAKPTKRAINDPLVASRLFFKAGTLHNWTGPMVRDIIKVRIRGWRIDRVLPIVGASRERHAPEHHDWATVQQKGAADTLRAHRLRYSAACYAWALRPCTQPSRSLQGSPSIVQCVCALTLWCSTVCSPFFTRGRPPQRSPHSQSTPRLGAGLCGRSPSGADSLG